VRLKVITDARARLIDPALHGLTEQAPHDVVGFYLAMRDRRAADSRRKHPLHVLQPAIDEMLAAPLQRYADDLLRDATTRKDPRMVFRKVPRRRRGERDPRLSQHRCLEVLRLSDFVGEKRAKMLVADAFGREPRTVERDLNRWSRRARDEGWLETYKHGLRVLRLLD
jgi:hypothetical protein